MLRSIQRCLFPAKPGTAVISDAECTWSLRWLCCPLLQRASADQCILGHEVLQPMGPEVLCIPILGTSSKCSRSFPLVPVLLDTLCSEGLRSQATSFIAVGGANKLSRAPWQVDNHQWKEWMGTRNSSFQTQGSEVLGTQMPARGQSGAKPEPTEVSSFLVYCFAQSVRSELPGKQPRAAEKGLKRPSPLLMLHSPSPCWHKICSLLRETQLGPADPA